MTEHQSPQHDSTSDVTDGVAKVHELIKDQRTAMLTTRAEDGSIVTRPMTCQEAEFDGTLWFLGWLDGDASRQMQADPKVLLMGEDIGQLGGVFRVTEGLQAEFGDKRVLDTPLAESAVASPWIWRPMGGECRFTSNAPRPRPTAWSTRSARPVGGPRPFAPTCWTQPPHPIFRTAPRLRSDRR